MKMLFRFVIFLCLLAPSLLHAQVKIDRDSFSVSYPSAWVLDTEDEDYDPDALFSFDSPDGENMIMFMLFNMELDLDLLLGEQVKEFSKSLLKNPEVIEFSKWGNYQGKGKILKGKLMGALKGFVKLFVYTDGNKTMLVVQQTYDKDYPILKKDYELIESSFRWK